MAISAPLVKKWENAVNWGLLIIVFVEWFTSYFFITINLFNFDHLLTLDKFLIFGIIGTPFWVIIIGLLSTKHQSLLNKIAAIGTPILAAIIGCVSYAAFIALFQLEPWTFRDPPGLDLENTVLMLLGKERRLVSWLLFSVNGLIFYGLVPMLFVKLKGSKNSSETGGLAKGLPEGLVITALYMYLRFGSIAGITYRLMLLMAGFLIIQISLWLVNQYFSNREIKEKLTGEETGGSYPRGLWYLYGFSLSMPTMSANGLIINNWVWLFLIGGILLSYLLKFILKKHLANLPANLLYKIILILHMGFSIGLILPQISGLFLKYQPLLISVNLLLLGSGVSVYPLQNLLLLKEPRQKFQGPKAKSIRMGGDSVLTLIGFLMPFLIGIQDPFSSWIFLVINTVICCLMFYRIVLKK